ncbi:MAG TPA: DUF2877 domain-containing protein [Ktedonobacteraceae bacterium]
MIKVLACSERVIERVMGPPQRGLVHSAFSSAANLVFPDAFLLSLNSLPPSIPQFDAREQQELAGAMLTARPRCAGAERDAPLMPNGLLLTTRADMWPFRALKVGMPVVLGAGWLLLETLFCSLDCRGCIRWNPRIERPAALDIDLLRTQAGWLASFCQTHRPQAAGETPRCRDGETMLELATRICGRGPGLTPSGDDFLAGWLAAGWLLYGPRPAFLAICQGINKIASQYTHALSQCWLAYASAGDLAGPICQLLTTLYNDQHTTLEHAANNVLALGATSGYDLLQGLLYGIEQFPLEF